MNAQGDNSSQGLHPRRHLQIMRTIWRFLLFLVVQLPGLAQPTLGLLTRVWMVEAKPTKSGAIRGTIFSIDVAQREYWITAKHVVTGATSPPYGTVPKTVDLRLLNPASAA